MRSKIDLISKQGFTFIEVLVVTTIIAVLTAVGVSNFGVANKKARDGKRKGDLEQIRAALELYYSDESDYPASLSFGSDFSSATETYMEVVPSDPKDDQNYVYSYGSRSFDLYALLEIETGDSYVGTDCGPGICNYKVSNPL